MHTFVPPPKLGIGFPYQRGMHEVIQAGRHLIDFFEISPELLCHERVADGQRFLDYHPTWLAEALQWTAERPVVIHGLSLSIGSASGWDENYLSILDLFHAHRSFVWHSEHLGFMLTTDAAGRPLHTGIPLPLPFTEEALDLLVPRMQALSHRYGVPFLIENLTYYLPQLPADGGRDEIAFLNDLVERSGCGLLLDLYNFRCNATNFGFDAIAALSRLRLDRVVEIHLAGGTTHDGFVLDVHSDVVPEPVWELLEWTVARTPHLAGIVYELLEQALPIVGSEGVCRQLERARHIWAKYNTSESDGGAYAPV